jgi:hypothetical protein
VEFLVKPVSVITGDVDDDAKEGDEPASPFDSLDKPTIVYVVPAGGGGDGYEKLETIVFKNEKVGLGCKAFRTIKIAPENADRDVLLADHGKGVPRLLIVDPLKKKVRVLEKSKFKAGTLYKEMKSVASKFWKENLDRTVKKQLKFMVKQDKLYGEQKTLRAKQDRLSDDDSAKAKKELEKIRTEMADLQKLLDELKEEQAKLWQLTPKHPKTPS